MLSDDDHPGVFTFLLGLIAVILAAVGLSLLSDTKFSVSRSPKALHKEIQTAAEELDRLTDHRRELARRLAEGEERTQAAQQTRTALRSELAEQALRLATLSDSRNQSQQAIPLMEVEFEDYRAKYRKQTWARAVGQALGTLKVGGREYRQAVIKRVTEVGLDIEFEGGGKARVQAPDLDPAIQDRFQWNDEERRQRLKEERDLQRAVAGADLPKPVPAPTVKPGPPPPRPGTAPAAAPDPDQLKALRRAVTLARAKVDRLNSLLNDARAAAARGEISVPGSLQTWRSRIVSLEALLSTANQELAIATANLAAVAPTTRPPR